MEYSKKETKIRQKLSNEKLTVFLICFFVALVFWILNALGKYFDYTCSVALEVKNIPIFSELNSSLPSSVNITLHGKGFDLAQWRFGNKQKKVIIDFSADELKSFLVSKKNNLPIEVIIKNKFLPPNGDISVLKVDPPTLLVDLSSRNIKKIYVRPLINVFCKPQFEISGPVQVNPPYINAAGPDSILSKTDTIYTELLQLNNLDKSINADLKIINLFPNSLLLEKQKVGITIPIEEYTEGEISIPIQLTSYANTYMLIPDKIKVRYTAPLSKFLAVSKDDFNARADINPARARNLADVKLTKIPQGVRVVSIVPLTTTYFVKK